MKLWEKHNGVKPIDVRLTEEEKAAIAVIFEIIDSEGIGVGTEIDRNDLSEICNLGEESDPNPNLNPNPNPNTEPKPDVRTYRLSLPYIRWGISLL